MHLLPLLLVSGLGLSACGSSSNATTPQNSPSSSGLPSAPTYQDVLANITWVGCTSATGYNAGFAANTVVADSAGVFTQCTQADALGQSPPFVNVQASCNYNLNSVAIGYSFTCTLNSPYVTNVLSGGAWEPCMDSTNNTYAVQMQTPQNGSWYFAYDNLANNQSTTQTSALTSLGQLTSGGTDFLYSQEPSYCTN